MLDYQKFRQAKAIEAKNKKRWLDIDPELNDNGGIYILTRYDEDGFKYAYVGQAKHILTRLSQHLVGYQHIDLSLKKHGLFDIKSNPYGWKVAAFNCLDEQLDELERRYIKIMADDGYQLRNKTSGSQGEGKTQIADYRPAKGYRDGLKQGRINMARELSHIIKKHLVVAIRDDKQGNKVSEKQFEKFKELLKEGAKDGEE